MMRRAFGSAEAANGFPGAPSPVTGSTRTIAPSSPTGSPAVRRSWERIEPPSRGGSPHGFGGAGPLSGSWPQSARPKCAASPAPAYSIPSGPNSTVPIEWLRYCWHHSSSITGSIGPATPSSSIRTRTSRADAGQPASANPGQTSFHTGGSSPILASRV